MSINATEAWHIDDAFDVTTMFVGVTQQNSTTMQIVYKLLWIEVAIRYQYFCI